MLQSEYLSIKELAAHIQASKSTIWNGVRKGIFPKPIKIGGLTRWRRSEVEERLSELALHRTK